MTKVTRATEAQRRKFGVVWRRIGSSYPQRSVSEQAATARESKAPPRRKDDSEQFELPIAK